MTPLKLFLAFVLGAVLPTLRAWDYEGHRVVNRLALESLPTNFPAFVRAADARERIAFLGGEMDRWRNTPDLPLRHINNPDHFLDLEDLDPFGLSPTNLSHFRHEFVAQLGAIRAANPDKFPAVDPTRDPDRTKWLPGFLPWAIAEQYAKLKSAFSYLRAYEEVGTGDEIANARANVIYLMGVMGHTVGDAAQPLHTTRHYNGWIGVNPRGYTTNRTFHGWIDGGYFQKAGLDADALLTRLRPARTLPKADPATPRADVFPEAIEFIQQQHPHVETLYELEKTGKLTGEGEAGRVGLKLLSEQLLKAGQLLGDLWLTAWQEAPADLFLKSSLVRRNAAAEANRTQ